MRTEHPQPNWRYTRTARWLHWILAVLIITMLAVGWTMTSMEHKPGASTLFSLHKSVGLAVLVLVTLRIIWRASHPAAPLPDYVPSWQKRLANATEWTLYVCMAVMPLTGYLGASHQKHPPAFFGLPTPAWALPDHDVAERFFSVHSFVAWPLAALILLHVAGALKHVLIDRDSVFRRMSVGAGKAGSQASRRA
jgi:cytochrome b561